MLLYITVFDVVSSPKWPTLSKIREGIIQRRFLLKKKFKNFKNFKNFTTFIPKVQLEGCFIITVSYLNRKKNKQKYEDLVQSKFNTIIFYINFFVKNFSKTEILPNSLGD